MFNATAIEMRNGRFWVGIFSDGIDYRAGFETKAFMPTGDTFVHDNDKQFQINIMTGYLWVDNYKIIKIDGTIEYNKGGIYSDKN